MQRREVQYFGNVQGVGFRFTAVQIASQHDVTGYVMNLPDGSVRMVVEGNEDEIDRFIDDVGDEMGRNIRSTDVSSAQPTGEFTDFNVRF
jgi:acylphosphatase